MQKEIAAIRSSATLPFLFVVLLWIVHLVQAVFSVDFTTYGLYPRTLHGLLGVLASPLLHGDWMHLFNNSIPIIFLGTMLFYFYRKIAFEVWFWIYIMSGVWLWIFARPSYHIGASTLVYGLASFLFFSGFIRRNFNLMSLSLLIVALYGSLIWGLLPILEHISWEGHAAGGLAGLLCAIYYRKFGTEVEEQTQVNFDDDPDDSDPYWLGEEQVKKEEQSPVVIYHYREGDKNED